MQGKSFTTSWLFQYWVTLIIVTLVIGVYIRALLNITPGSPLALYRDGIIITFLHFSVCTLLLQFKSVIRNKMDIMFFIFILFGLFEILWTYYLTDSLFIGVFRFRLYFPVYLMYFPFVYFFREWPTTFHYTLKAVKIIFAVSFIWAISEFILINARIIPVEAVSSFLERGMTGAGSSNYSNLGGYFTIIRGYGIIAHVVNSGIFCVIGLTIFLPIMLERWNFNARLYMFLGIAAVVCSFGKTAWLLLLFVFFTMLIGQKKRRFFFATLLLSSVALLSYMYLNFPNFRGTIDPTINKVSTVCLTSLHDFSNASLIKKVFGFGYEVHSGDIATFGLSKGSEFSLTVGSEVFLVALFRQWGALGIILYLTIFIIMPITVFFKSRDFLVSGMALAIVVAGLSSVHYNAIFKSGVNIITCLLLAGLSVLHYDSKSKRGLTEQIQADTQKR